jgi:hypothetical protein
MRTISRHFLAAIAMLSLGLPARSQAPTPPPSFPWEAEVTGTNVYVRSGAGANWYPTTKLNTGDHVVVIGEHLGWYKIEPPAGSLSYIDMTSVDRKPGASTATVRQDGTYVRAGSQLPNIGQKSSTQLVLKKGATVTITGEADGFYRIAPPAGAGLYIARQFVRPVPPNLRTGMVERYLKVQPPEAVPDAPAGPGPVDSTPRAGDGAPAGTGIAVTAEPVATGDAGLTIPEPEKEGTSIEPEPAGGTATGEEPVASAGQPAGKKPPAAPGRAKGVPGSEGKKDWAMLELLDAEARPVVRDSRAAEELVPFIGRYERIAAQAGDEKSTRVARIRVRQLHDRIRQLRDMATNAEEQRLINEQRARQEEEREKIRNRRIERAKLKYDFEGRLKKTHTFPFEKRRYRLTDPQHDVTLCYVDIPEGVAENPDHLIGQLVGIRVAARHFDPAARQPIVVAAEVVDLSPRTLQGQGRPPPGLTRPNNPPPDDNSNRDSAASARPPADTAADAGPQADPDP